ncbi:MAG: DUF1801 domain-containing protein [Candidatus Izemoplasmatales bacterium]|jgi:hypothetical protein|nr:DUF1801 domain-containing protein [Candidatus Izemoplasmatales bacterium]
MEITNLNINSFIERLDEQRKADIIKLVDLMKEVTNKEPKLWGSIIGFGRLKYVYKSGHSGEMPVVGLASRKQAITLYLSYDINKLINLNKLGKYKTGKGCLYIKKLDDIDINVMRTLIVEAIKDTKNLDFITEME